MTLCLLCHKNLHPSKTTNVYHLSCTQCYAVRNIWQSVTTKDRLPPHQHHDMVGWNMNTQALVSLTEHFDRKGPVDGTIGVGDDAHVLSLVLDCQSIYLQLPPIVGNIQKQQSQ